MKKLIFTSVMIALASISPANSQYLNTVIQESVEGSFSNQVKQTDTKLIYETNKNDTFSLWSMDLSTKNKEKILTASNGERASYFNKINNEIFFNLISDNDELHLWRSDGTKSGTQKVSETVLYEQRQTRVYGDYLFTLSKNKNLHQLRDNDLVNLDIPMNSLDAMCIFNSDHFIYKDINQTNDIYSIKHYNNGQISGVIDYPKGSYSQAEFIKYNNTCYLHDIIDDERTILSLPADGGFTVFNESGALPKVSRLFTHDQRLYAIVGNDNLFNSIYRLLPDLQNHDASVYINERFYFRRAKSANHLITSTISEVSNFEGYSSQFFIDADLNFVDSYFDWSQFSIFGVHETLSDVLVGFDTNSDDAVIQSIDSNNKLTIHSVKDYYFEGIVSSSGSDQFYTKLRNKNNNNSNIYSIDDKPYINDLINGTWHNPDIINQGLVIQKGRRLDGTEYMFSTLFTFDQGEPLWLAGTSDLSSPQSSLEIAMYAFDGIQMFDYNVSPNREVFGHLLLELETCHKLKATISSDNYNDSIYLFRIDDTSYNHLCADISMIELNSSNKSMMLLENGHE